MFRLTSRNTACTPVKACRAKREMRLKRGSRASSGYKVSSSSMEASQLTFLTARARSSNPLAKSVTACQGCIPVGVAYGTTAYSHRLLHIIN